MVDAISQRVLELVCGNATVALFVIDEQHHCVYMNPSAERVTGFTLEEVQGRSLHDLLHHTRPDGTPYPSSECPIHQAFPARDRVEGEEMFVRKDGTFYPVAYKASFIPADGAQVAGVFEIRDLSEAKEAAQKADDELRLSASRIVTAAKHSNFLPSQSDRDARYVWVFSARPDFDPANWLGRTDVEIMDNEGARRLMALKLEVVRTGDGVQEEIDLQMSDGVHTYDTIIEPLLDDKGNVAGVTTAACDITVIKRGERDRERLLRALEQERDLVRQLSAPVLRVVKHLLLVPLTGVIDHDRAYHISQTLMDAITRQRARVVVLDLTGVASMDQGSISWLAEMIAAAKLIGARVIVTGISVKSAQAAVAAGSGLRDVQLAGDLEQGIELGMRELASFPGRPDSLDGQHPESASIGDNPPY